MDIGSKLKELRKSKKIKIRELIALLGISRSQYFKKENNIHKTTLEELTQLKNFYGVDGNYFFN